MATLTASIETQPVFDYTINPTSYDTFALTFIDNAINRGVFREVSCEFDISSISIPSDLSQWITITVTQPATGGVVIKWDPKVRVAPGVSISTAASASTTVYAFAEVGNDWVVYPSTVSAAASDLSSQFAPLVPSEFFIPAGSCLYVSGTRTESHDGNVGGFTIGSAGTTGIVGTFLVPTGVTSVTVTALWTLISGQSAGDVRHAIARSTFTSGEPNLTGLGSYDPGSDFFITTAPAATALAATSSSDVTAAAVSAGKLFGIIYIRDGSNVGDTAGNTRFFGFRVVVNP